MSIPGIVFKKGRVLGEADIAKLAAAGQETVYAAKLGPDDMPEDEAAQLIAQAVRGDGLSAQMPFTGRANLHALVHGLAVVDLHRIKALNRIDESLTLATLPNFAIAAPRQLVATVKIIPFAVPRAVVEEALALIGNEPLVRIEEFRHRNVGLVITRLPQTKPSLIKKSEDAMRERIEALDGKLAKITVCDHQAGAVADAVKSMQAEGCNPILVFGASAIVDRGDIIPAALAEAGGDVVHLGMPVDPGNLAMFGRLGGVPVIGVPSCARSPKLNGFDWLLQRVMAGIHVSSEDIMDMGAGGLLSEIPSRPSPREGAKGAVFAPRTAAVLLAAGTSSRMGHNKLLAPINGKPMIRVSAANILAGGITDLHVVTGRDQEAVLERLVGLPVKTTFNPHYKQGLSTSLVHGIRSLPKNADAVFICLGDMPRIQPQTFGKIIAAFNPAEHRSICVPVHDGQRGNPVLWGRAHFQSLLELEGDRGARSLMNELSGEVVEVPVSDAGILIDADTPEALAQLQIS
ncbi:MAG: NTP transferase domain-containing protein [Aestuariivirga sp.]